MLDKKQLISKYNLQQATFTADNTRKAMTDKELATLRALCKTKTFDLHILVDDIDNVANFNGDVDIKLAQSGNAKEHTLISIWSRNKVEHVTKKSDYRDFGVRFHASVFEHLAEEHKQFLELVNGRVTQVYSHKDGAEVRYTFESLSDCLKFIADVAEATQQKQTEAKEQKQKSAQQKQKSTTKQKSKSTEQKQKRA